MSQTSPVIRIGTKVKPHKSWQDYTLDKQVKLLSSRIREDMHKIANHVRLGRLDRAGQVIRIVAHNMGRLEQVSKELHNMKPEKAPPPVEAHSKLKMKPKVKRYPTWSDK